MKEKLFHSILLLAILIIFSGCGSGTGTPAETETPTFAPSSDRVISFSRPGGPEKTGIFSCPDCLGIISVNITGGTSVLPLNTNKFLITFDEFSIFNAKGGWKALPLARSPFTVDLFRLPVRGTIHLVPAVKIASRGYKKIRIGVSSAIIRIKRNEHPVNIPPYSLKTEKGFDFEMMSEGTVNLTVDFDFSRSIVDYGSEKFALNPAFNIVHAQKAAIISGNIKKSTFDLSSGPSWRKEAVVVIYCDRNNNRRPDYGEDYTRMRVKNRSEPTSFCIHWLAPKRNYIVSLEVDNREIFRELVAAQNLIEGSVFELNKGKPI